MKDILLVAFGAVFGANIRYLICQEFKKLNIDRRFSILTINVLASFFLGLFISIFSRIISNDFLYHFSLLFLIGFLGSLSTFSSFVYDSYDLILKFKFILAFKLVLLSLSLGIIALAFGFFLGSL